MRLTYRPAPHWPPLVWVAECSADAVEVAHGPDVEVRDGWFCEAVWDGAFDDGGFDRTDVVFGSGGRLRDGAVRFVSSASTVDRLQSFEDGGRAWVSNSLAALLSVVGKRPDPTFGGYFRLMGSITQGIRRYDPLVPLTRGSARLVYYRDLKWDGRRLREAGKPAPDRDFSTFDLYRSFLSSALGALAANGADPARRRPYALAATLSSGYDSATAVVLAQEHGLSEALSLAHARGGAADDGRATASALGLPLRVVDREAWREEAPADVAFFAADAKGEDVYLAGAGDALAGSVLVTGFHGGRVWARDPKPEYLTADLYRGDRSGLSLTEYRLLRGFLHVPLAFLGARQAADIHAVSTSPEMAPWDVPGDYSRPICRRIVEEAGVPRAAFGMKKKAASVLFQNGTALAPASDAAYRAWLRERGARLGRSGRIPAPVAIALRSAADAALGATAGSPGDGRLRRGVKWRLNRAVGRAAERLDLHKWLFPWAVDVVSSTHYRQHA